MGVYLMVLKPFISHTWGQVFTSKSMFDFGCFFSLEKWCYKLKIIAIESLQNGMHMKQCCFLETYFNSLGFRYPAGPVFGYHVKFTFRFFFACFICSYLCLVHSKLFAGHGFVAKSVQSSASPRLYTSLLLFGNNI